MSGQGKEMNANKINEDRINCPSIATIEVTNYINGYLYSPIIKLEVSNNITRQMLWSEAKWSRMISGHEFLNPFIKEGAVIKSLVIYKPNFSNFLENIDISNDTKKILCNIATVDGMSGEATILTGDKFDLINKISRSDEKNTDVYQKYYNDTRLLKFKLPMAYIDIDKDILFLFLIISPFFIGFFLSNLLRRTFSSGTVAIRVLTYKNQSFQKISCLDKFRIIIFVEFVIRRAVLFLGGVAPLGIAASGFLWFTGQPIFYKYHYEYGDGYSFYILLSLWLIPITIIYFFLSIHLIMALNKLLKI